LRPAIFICRLRRKRGFALPPKGFAFRRDILSRMRISDKNRRGFTWQ
jgi:hypothetical protein